MSGGRVYWITGLSNSGKTTIGTALYYELKKINKNTVILDGDLMKQIASGSENASYSTHDRYIRAKRYALMSKLLSDQGLWVVVCAIAMFDEIREWNRKNIKGYIEVFLDVPEEILRMRDKKGLLTEQNDMELPKKPDLIVFNDGTRSIRNIVKEIKMLVPLRMDDYDRDREYWNHYYKDIRGGQIKPSDFAVFIEKQLNRKSHILDLGCGNGRDSLYFLSMGHNIIGIDGSDSAIDFLNNSIKNDENALFVCDDFVKCQAIYQLKFDCIYSRFTLHAITEEQENELLYNVKEALANDGFFCIEARTIHDDIFGKGEKVSDNAYIYNNHYRRFIDVDGFKNKVETLGFKVIYLEESNGFSKNENSDPILMRCIISL